MSNRKQRRAKQARNKKPGARRALPHTKPRAVVADQYAEERFAVPGAAQLWTGLLGWDDARVLRMRLAEVIHDEARRSLQDKTIDIGRAQAQLSPHAPEAAASLDAEQLETHVQLWRAAPAAFDPSDPAPVWQALANLSPKLGLGPTTAERLGGDWQIWVTPALAEPHRKAVMSLLTETDRAASALSEVTESANVAAARETLQLIWYAFAYGDDTTFKRLRALSSDWLAESRARMGSGQTSKSSGSGPGSVG